MGSKGFATSYLIIFGTLVQLEPAVPPPGSPNGDPTKCKDFFHHCRQALLTVGIIRDAVGGKHHFNS